MISTKKIEEVIIHHNFYKASATLGYTPEIILDYEKEIVQLAEKWSSEKQVEIYDQDNERAWGRIKSCSANTNSPGAIPYYIDFFHSRVVPNENDPLLLITFKNNTLFIRMFTDHEDLFGSKAIKNNNFHLKRIKQRISEIIKENE